jgi:phosphatidylglycerol:prolipoprotein diacylglycerol transferase
VTALESLLVSLRGLPFPGAWLSLQLLALFLASLCFLRHTRSAPELRRSFVLSLPFGLAGALAFGALFRWIDFAAFGGPDDFTGVSAFGAFAGVGAAFAVLVRRNGQSAGPALDRLAPALLVLLGVGRVGCFAAGCDGGSVSSLPWAVRFPAGSQIFRGQVARGLVLPSDHHSLAVHPSQLYEVLIVLPAALLLSLLLRQKGSASGRLFFLAALVYCVARIGVDGLRQGLRGPNYGQWMAALALSALVVSFRAASRRDTLEREA